MLCFCISGNVSFTGTDGRGLRAVGHSLPARMQWKLSLQGVGSEHRKIYSLICHFMAITFANILLKLLILHQLECQLWICLNMLIHNARRTPNPKPGRRQWAGFFTFFKDCQWGYGFKTHLWTHSWLSVSTSYSVIFKRSSQPILHIKIILY